MKDSFIGTRKVSAKKALEKLSGKKSLSTLKNDLQKVFNEFIRLRDTRYDKGQPYFLCISCQQPKGLDMMHAGHYFSVGGHEAVRFDENNTHGQCSYCNTYMHGNLVAYKKNLINKIGQSAFDVLEIRSRNRSKMFEFEVTHLIEHYKAKIQELKNKRQWYKSQQQTPTRRDF